MTVKIFLVSARYSDNLGDGVIGDCVEHVIRRDHPGVDVYHVDIAGRKEFAPRTHVGLQKKVFYLAPGFVKPLMTKAAWPFVFDKKIEASCSAFHGARGGRVVFCGGQVVSDIALNFPLKIRKICQIAKRNSLDISFSSVGASRNWSREAKNIFCGIFSDPSVKHISVRDHDSAANLASYGVKAQVAVDPAVWASDVYGSIHGENVDKKLIGVGISSPHELAAHSDGGMFGIEGHIKFWTDLIGCLRSMNFRCAIFNNGSIEDDEFMRLVASRLGAGDDLKVLDRPKYPADLGRAIGMFDGIISHRLHANILAFSYGIPSISLKWDKKVASFAEIIDRSDSCLSVESGAISVAKKMAIDIAEFDSILANKKLQQLRAMYSAEIRLAIKG